VLRSLRYNVHRLWTLQWRRLTDVNTLPNEIEVVLCVLEAVWSALYALEVVKGARRMLC